MDTCLCAVFERERNDQMLAKTLSAVRAHPGKRILVEVADAMRDWWK